MSMKGSFTSLACSFPSISPLPLHLHLFMHQGEIEIYQGARPCLCRLRGSKFWKRSCSLKPPGQEVMRKFWEREREREGWRTLWCAEIDNIKGSLTKTHFLATTQASSCVTGWCNNLDECEADGCRLSSLYPRMIWDMILENVGLLCMRGQSNSGSQQLFILFFFVVFGKNPCTVSYLTDMIANKLCMFSVLISLIQ